MDRFILYPKIPAGHPIQLKPMNSNHHSPQSHLKPPMLLFQSSGLHDKIDIDHTTNVLYVYVCGCSGQRESQTRKRLVELILIFPFGFGMLATNPNCFRIENPIIASLLKFYLLDPCDTGLCRLQHSGLRALLPWSDAEQNHGLTFRKTERRYRMV